MYLWAMDDGCDWAHDDIDTTLEKMISNLGIPWWNRQGGQASFTSQIIKVIFGSIIMLQTLQWSIARDFGLFM